MHRAAMDLNAIREGAGMRVETFIGWQESRMDVDHPTLPAAHEPGRQQAHKSGQAQKLDAMNVQQEVHAALEILPRRIDPVIHGRDRDPRAFREFQSRCCGIVGQNESHIGAEARRASRLD